MKKETLFGYTGEELLKILNNAPIGVKNALKGYITEILLEKHLKTIPEIQSVERGNHRLRATDFVLKYKNKEIKIENKKIQENLESTSKHHIVRRNITKKITNSSETPYLISGSIKITSSNKTHTNKIPNSRKEDLEIICCSYMDEANNIQFIFTNAHLLNSPKTIRGSVIENGDPNDFLCMEYNVLFPPKYPWTTNIIEVLNEQLKYNKTKKKKQITLFD
jgi:hypothetical protein